MGLFGKKPKASSLEPRKLRQGTQVAMVDVDSEFVEYARTHVGKTPKLGHIMRVFVQADKDNILVIHNSKVVGKMRPEMVRNYIGEVRALVGMGQIGWTEAAIKWEGSKSPHALLLNWGSGAADDGGIL
jgi:hypothetical protein